MTQIDKSRQPKSSVEKNTTPQYAQRVPLGRYRDILTVMGKDPNYYYRWVVDTMENGSRIMELKRAGYMHVQADEVQVGEDKVDHTTSEGAIVKYQYKGTTLYLMKQPMEFRLEDQKVHADEVDEVERQILNPTIDPQDPTHSGQYGRIDVRR